MARLRTLLDVLQRRRVFQPEDLETGNLKRCLNQWDLTALGLGSTLGVGVYVLVGSVALRVAGPSVVLSFLVAAVAALFAGLCYAEFASRVPRAGSAYIYTYVTVGEFAAFVVGWSMILEALFGTASLARGLSMFVDALAGQAMSAWFRAVMPIDYGPFSAHFDLFAFVVVLVLGVMLAFGVRESSMVNNVLSVINMVTIVFIIIVGAFRADSTNWSLPPSVVPIGSGEGGFFPFGVWGMLRGAAICFYGFVGFDSISATSEEVHKPRRSIPIAMVSVLLVVSVVYCAVSIVVTMMVPYYLQDPMAAVATVFMQVGWNWARWIVSVGAIFGISSSLFGALLPLPRLLYAMSSDLLLPALLARISGNRTPVVATLMCAVVISILSAVLELEQLVMMCCVGTLLSYTLVAACVVILRYQSVAEPIASSSYTRQILGFGNKSPSRLSAMIVYFCLTFFVITSLAQAVVTLNAASPLVPSLALHGVLLALLAVMALQPGTKDALDFMTPLVPLVPCLSIYFNVHLMLLINYQTWIRVIIWLFIGIPIYALCVCCYKRVKSNLQDNLATYTHTNGKQTLQIVVDPPTPPDTIRGSDHEGDKNNNNNTMELMNKIEVLKKPHVSFKIEEEVIVQQAVIDYNEDGEAKIIDLLDQVIQAEEDTYGEVASVSEEKEEEVLSEAENIPHRMSLSELSEADSEASLANIIPPKYDTIVQVHREDLSKVNEEPEAVELENDDDENEKVTFFNDSETSSRTDESGYSDTTDNNHLNESFEQRFENPDENSQEARIPTPPPPPPPPLPLDDGFFVPTPAFKSYTVPAKSNKASTSSLDEEENLPRESVQSNNSNDDSVMGFGSSKQQKFMSKLNNLFQNKITNPQEDKLRRSNSTGNVMDSPDLRTVEFERPSVFIPSDLKKELLARQSFTLRPTKSAEIEEPEEKPDDIEEEASLSKEDFKSKLENIFATGPKLVKPRLIKNPPTTEDYPTDVSSTESLPKLPKMDKNDTLKRQKDKFSEVLNSFRLSFKDDVV